MSITVEKVKETIQLVQDLLPNSSNFYTFEQETHIFEQITELLDNRNMDYLVICIHLYIYDKKTFEQFDYFFQKVHGLIRRHAMVSKQLKAMLGEIALKNHQDNTGFYYGQEDYIKAYNKVLDQYAPSNKKYGMPNWEGYSSLIETQYGLFKGFYLEEPQDLKLFYEVLQEQEPIKVDQQSNESKVHELLNWCWYYWTKTN